MLPLPEAAQTKLSIQEKASIKKELITRGISPSELSGISNNELIALLDSTPTKEKPKTESAPTVVTESAPKTTPKTESAPKTEAPSTIPAEVQKFFQSLTGSSVLDESRVIDLIKQHTTVTNSVDVTREGKQTVTIDNAHFQFAEVLSWIKSGVNVYLAGPAGCGKTTIAQQVAQSLELPFYFTGAIMDEYKLFGYCDANGNYVSTEFRQAFEHGGVFLKDELDGSSESVCLSFNAALANRVCAFPDKTIKAHKDFICIAAANTKGKGATRQYNGRNPLDGATLDRFVILDIEYDLNIELTVTQAIVGDIGKARAIVEHVRELREKAEQLQLDAIISPRACYDAARGISAGIPFTRALTGSLYNKLDDTARKQLGV